jgi:hypothetical protein
MRVVFCLLVLTLVLCLYSLPCADAQVRAGPGAAPEMDMGALLGALGSMNRGSQNKKAAPKTCPNGHMLVQNNKPLESNGCSKPAFMQIDGEVCSDKFHFFQFIFSCPNTLF